MNPRLPEEELIARHTEMNSGFVLKNFQKKFDVLLITMAVQDITTSSSRGIARDGGGQWTPDALSFAFLKSSVKRTLRQIHTLPVPAFCFWFARSNGAVSVTPRALGERCRSLGSDLAIRVTYFQRSATTLLCFDHVWGFVTHILLLQYILSSRVASEPGNLLLSVN